MTKVQTFSGRLLALAFCLGCSVACSTDRLEPQTDLQDSAGAQGEEVPSDVESEVEDDSSTPAESEQPSQNETSESSENEGPAEEEAGNETPEEEPNPEEEEEPEEESPAEWETRLVLLDGYDGVLYLSDDDGQTWRHGGTTPFEGPTKPALIANEEGAYLLTHTRGAVVFSYDSGETWGFPTSAPWGSDGPDETPCQHVNLVLGHRGALYAASTHSQRDGILYRSDDHGMNWTQVGTWPHQSGMMHALEITDAGVIFVAHTPYEGAPVFRSEDGGVTFEEVTPYNQSTFGGVALLTSDSSGTLYAVGNPESTLYRSFDGGDSWESAGSWEDPRSISSFKATAEDVLVAISVKGPALTSTDLGTSLELVGDWGTAADRDILCCSGWTTLMTEQIPLND